MASILLSAIKGIGYGPHNLVADMLLLGHDAVLKECCGLEEFITSYKRKHKINHNVEDSNIMYARLFGSATNHDGGATIQEDTPKSPILKDATRDINEIPLPPQGKPTQPSPPSIYLPNTLRRQQRRRSRRCTKPSVNNLLC